MGAPLTDVGSLRLAQDEVRHPLAANIRTTTAHGQLARFKLENAFINAAICPCEIPAACNVSSAAGRTYKRSVGIAVQSFWVK